MSSKLKKGHPAAAVHVLSCASNPFRCRNGVGEVFERTVFQYGNNWFPASPCGIWATVFEAVQVEVLPSLSAAFLHPLAKVLTPFLALVGWYMSFHEPAVLLVHSRIDGIECQFSVTHISYRFYHQNPPMSDGGVQSFLLPNIADCRWWR